LGGIAKFDSYGLWHCNDIHFSKHGNLKQTLIHLINTSENGLNATEIGGLLRMGQRSFLWHFSKLKEIQRIKIDGAYVWFSADAATFQRQETTRLGISNKKMAVEMKDSIAILILVERIKNPGLELEALAELLHKQGINIKPSNIAAFFNYHGIEKKNNFPDPEVTAAIDR
jgi:hypothetical protein